MRYAHGKPHGCCWLLLASWLAVTGSMAQSNYAAFELRREQNWDPIALEDVDGDGRKDIIVSHFAPALGRELHIFHQQATGRFSATPQRVEIKTEIVAVGFADLRSDPGKELVLFAGGGVFSLSTARQGYAQNLRLLTRWDLLTAIPEPQQVHFTDAAMDVNQDGLVDLLLPGESRYGLFFGRGEERFKPVLDFSTLNPAITPLQRRRGTADVDANLDINAEQGVVVEVKLTAPTPFAGFVQVWNPQQNPQDALLQSEQWMPAVKLAQLNADGLPDMAYVNANGDGQRRINIHWQGPHGSFNPTADWSAALAAGGELELVDMNADGMADLWRLSGDGNQRELRLYLNRGGHFALDTPDQVMRLSGYEMDVQVVSLPQAGGPVLMVSFYTVPVMEGIRNAGIERSQLLYRRDPQQVFQRRPAARLQQRFSAATVRGLSQAMALHYDVDGDGNNDALYVTANGTLAAKAIDQQLQLAAEPFWEYVSPKTVFEFEVLQLNADSRPDLLLRHGTSTTLLVALP